VALDGAPRHAEGPAHPGGRQLAREAKCLTGPQMHPLRIAPPARLDEKAAQAQYDDETANGRTPAQQARWEKDVASQLVALGKYV